MARQTRYLPHTLALLLALGWLLAASIAGAATLTAEPGRERLSINDQLNLSVKLKNGRQNATDPDFSVLQGDFEILNISRRTESYTVNWETESYLIWDLVLSPKRRGQLTIPSFQTDGAMSEPVTIEVTDPPSSPADADAELFLSLSASRDSVYVQEQVLITAKLFSKYNWSGKELGNFDLDGAFIEAVSEDEYITEINGTQHLVYEVTFALYPQKSGTLTLPPLEYAVQLRTNNRSLLSFGNGPVRRGRSDSLSIEVKPIPENHGGDTWLPARNVKLTQHFSHDPESLVAGEPVTRRVTIEADGLLPTQLPPIEFAELPGFSSYKDKAQTNEQRSNKGIVSTRTETLAMVPNAAGTSELPPITLRWFNTATGDYETARLPGLTVKATMPANARSVPTATEPEQPGSLAGTGSILATPYIPLWLIISQSVTALLLLVFAGLYFFSPKRSSPRKQEKKSSDQGEWKAVKRAAADKNLPKLRQQLLHWASRHWQRPVRSLDELARLADSAAVNEQLQALDTAIYGGKNSAFDPGQLLPMIQALRVNKRDAKQAGPAPLYPETGHHEHAP
ncbi:BatD family protein [Gilvimarinus algae]|uniref:BatD family protein n=1 Tax=Gilvimarinus algae TaxID=3058037 RepID=A0ABT8TDK1_9GAMM|nr:BatD family protein [Gilvimarinus sp. SDUM040014]MDO3382201.1 BatD family protein [Gilvimarinus sp. SDUM040014]